jgi:PII-like signaling protein
MNPSPAKILRVHLSERDQRDGRRLYEVIVEKCRETGIAGATVFRGLEGFGGSTGIHRSHVLGHDLPIVITIVDNAEAIARLLPAIEPLLDKGVLAVSDVEMIRVEKSRG